MGNIKTVQLPTEVWELLRLLAQQQDRTIAAYLRNKIREDAVAAGIVRGKKKA